MARVLPLLQVMKHVSLIYNVGNEYSVQNHMFSHLRTNAVQNVHPVNQLTSQQDGHMYLTLKYGIIHVFWSM